MPWLSSKKTTVFHFQPEQTSQPPITTTTFIEEASVVPASKGVTTQVTTLAIEDDKGQEQGMWVIGTQMIGTVASVVGMVAVGGKQAYDVYKKYNKN